MAKCIRCGKDAWPNKRVCYDCMEKWKKKRTVAFDQAVAELGPLTKETHPAITKRVKELEKERE